jgi:hypothetical protein
MFGGDQSLGALSLLGWAKRLGRMVSQDGEITGLAGSGVLNLAKG